MADKDDDVRTIHWRTAASGRVGYSDPIILHESSRSKIVLVPFYIHRSHGSELAVKIQGYRKGEPPNDWVLFGDKSISLDEAAARALLVGLREHLAVAKEDPMETTFLSEWPRVPRSLVSTTLRP